MSSFMEGPQAGTRMPGFLPQTHMTCSDERDIPRVRVALVPQGQPAAPHPPCSLSLRFGDHFEWNKVTSCIHNILSGQRWIEHYGEVLIRNTQDSSCHCKLTFCKVGDRLPPLSAPAAPPLGGEGTSF